MAKVSLERIDSTLFTSFSPSTEPWVVGGSYTIVGTYTLPNGVPADCDQDHDADACYPDVGP